MDPYSRTEGDMGVKNKLATRAETAEGGQRPGIMLAE